MELAICPKIDTRPQKDKAPPRRPSLSSEKPWLFRATYHVRLLPKSGILGAREGTGLVSFSDEDPGTTPSPIFIRVRFDLIHLLCNDSYVDCQSKHHLTCKTGNQLQKECTESVPPPSFDSSGCSGSATEGSSCGIRDRTMSFAIKALTDFPIDCKS